jgi:hypothetical protein
MKNIKMLVCLATLAAVGLFATGCVTGKSHTTTLNDHIKNDGTVYHHDTDWTISSPLNIPVEAAETVIHIVKSVGEDVVGTSCAVGVAVIAPPQDFVAGEPEYYVWDGYENVGWYNNQMYFFGSSGWIIANPVVINHFYGYRQQHPGWANERHWNGNGGFHNGGGGHQTGGQGHGHQGGNHHGGGNHHRNGPGH